MKKNNKDFKSSSFKIIVQIISILLFILVNTQCSKAQDEKVDLNMYAVQLDKIMSTHYQNGQFQGAVLVVMNGEMIYRKAFGYANIEWEIPNAPETKFTIASLGKAFTAAIILQLVEEGKIKLDDPISKHLSTYRKDIGMRVTIHQLLRHTSGIPWSDRGHKLSYTFNDLVMQANEYELLFEPGTQFDYSNSGYNLLGAMIQEITGNSFEDELNKRILIPNKMYNTGLVKNRPILEKRAVGYDRLPGGEFLNTDWQDQSYAWGAGGMYSTVDDLYKWDRALYNDNFLSAKSRELMFTAGLRSAGYGWNVGKYKKNNVEGLGTLANGFGGTNGFSSLIARLLEDRYFIVALSNMNQIPQGRIANDLWNTILDFEVEPTLSSADTIYAIALKDGVSPAVMRYKEMLVLNKEASLPNESGINRAGYVFLRMDDRIKDAIRIFELNVELHPESANVYDSLGEAYMILGKTDKAIDNYKKALQIDPKMKSAIDALKKLRNE